MKGAGLLLLIVVWYGCLLTSDGKGEIVNKKNGGTENGMVQEDNKDSHLSDHMAL